MKKLLILLTLFQFSLFSLNAQNIYRNGIQNYANESELRNDRAISKQGDKIFLLNSKLFYVWDANSVLPDNGNTVIKQANQEVGRFINYSKNYTETEKNKLSLLPNNVTPDAILLNRNNHTGLQSINTIAGLQNALDLHTQLTNNVVNSLASKVTIVEGKRLSTEDYTTAEKTKLSNIANGATVNSTDAQLRDRSTHTGTQLSNTISDLPSLLDNKVDKNGSKQLSDENYTLAEKNKLASVNPSATVNSTDAVLLNRGNHTGSQSIGTINNLQDSLTNKVTKIVGKDLSSNDYTTTEKSKLAGIAQNATANSSDAVLLDRANHTGTQSISTIANLQSSLNGKAGLSNMNSFQGINTFPLIGLTAQPNVNIFTPSGGSILYSNSSSQFGWKSTNGFFVNFVNGTNTADRTYRLPDSSGTVALTSNLTSKQNNLVGTGFVKSAGGTISYDNSTYLTGITSTNVTTALGYTPYNATNPNGYISSVPAQTFASLTGKPTTIAGYGITDAYSSSNPSGYITSSALAPYGLLAGTQTWSGVNNFSNNLGVGTNSPFSKLHVNSYVTENVFATIGNPLGGIMIGHGANNEGIIGGYSATNLRFGYNVASTFVETMRLNTTGNLGIGTATPSTKLHVTGGVAMTSGWSRNTVLESNYPVLTFNSTAAGKYAGIGYDGTSNMNFWVGGTTEDVVGTGIPAISIQSSTGNIGVRNSAPLSALDVSGNININGNLWLSNGTFALWDGGYYNIYNRIGQPVFNINNSFTYYNSPSHIFRTINGIDKLNLESASDIFRSYFGKHLFGNQTDDGTANQFAGDVKVKANLSVTGVITSGTGFNITGNGGYFNAPNKFGVDFHSGNTRFYSSGADVNTKGGYEFHSVNSTGTGDNVTLLISNLGRIGINNWNPQHALDVNGNTQTNGLFIRGMTLPVIENMGGDNIYGNMRVIRTQGSLTDGMHIGYQNTGNGGTKIYDGGDSNYIDFAGATLKSVGFTKFLLGNQTDDGTFAQFAGDVKVKGVLRLNDNMAMLDNQWQYWKDTGGSDRRLVGMSSNNMYFGDIDNIITGSQTVLTAKDNVLIYVNGSEKVKIKSNGNVGIGTTTPTSKLQVTNGDIEVETINTGIILKSPNGTRYRITVNNSGVLTTSTL